MIQGILLCLAALYIDCNMRTHKHKIGGGEIEG